MPSAIITIQGEVLEGADATIVARIPTADGTMLVQGDNGESTGTEIDYKVFDLDGDTPATALNSGTLDKTAVIFDTLQTDGYWDNEDETGYNFRHTLATGDMPEGGHRAKIEYKITTTSFGEVKWQAVLEVKERFDG